MSKLIQLCGLPASGKSTLSKELAIQENAIIVSSDEMRKELFGDVNNQENNAILFEKLHERINKLLSEGRNVIYDATNINRKRRMNLINNVLKADEYVAYYMNTTFEECILRDSERDRQVGYDVINRMYKTLHIPTKLEGWDKVVFYTEVENGSIYFKKEWFENKLSDSMTHESLFNRLGYLDNEFEEVLDMPHDSSYHSFSISRHIFHVFQYVKENYNKDLENRYKQLLVASLFHDVGKARCKSFYSHKGELKRFASFLGHENSSAQLACKILTKLGYDDDFVKNVVDLVQFHMMPMNMSEKQEKRLRTLLTKEQYEDLMFLHKADLSAK